MIKQTFLQGKINKSTDERVFPKGAMRDARNIRVSGSEGSDVGAIENCLGNEVITRFELTNADVIGQNKDESSLLIYFFITSDEKDLLIEYNKATGLPVVVLESSTGGVLNFSKDNLITGLNKIINGEPEKDLYAWTDDRNPPRCINIARAKTYEADGFVEDDISLIKKPPNYAPTLAFNKTISLENFLEDKFLSFTYRYKYLDGEYSALSSFTNYAFTPNRFSLDYETMENLGMVNSFNEIVISFDTGSKRVIEVEVAFKESNSNNVYIIERFNKADEGWVDENETKTLTFNNSKIYKILPEDELYRAYDNVPRLAKAQELIGNRLVFSNYLEGYNIKDALDADIKLDYEVSLSSLDLSYISLVYGTSIAGDVDLAETIIIDLTDIELVQGMRLDFDFALSAAVGTGTFIHSFNYTLTQDYDNCNELASDPSYIYFIEELMSSVFADNVSATQPSNTISESYTPFTIAGGDATHLNIKPGKVIFVVDNTPEDLDDNDTSLEWMGFSVDNITDISYRIVNSDASLKTNRSYEVGIIYLDDHGRSTTVLTNPNNTVYIDQTKSTSQNKIKVSVNHRPPYWATRYKFVFKENRKSYNTMYFNYFIEDGLYRWVKLEGTNRDKVKEGDVLIVKSDLAGPVFDIKRITVLEVTSQPQNFIPDNFDDAAEEIETIESAGLYMKIKPFGISMSNATEPVQTYESFNYSLDPSKGGKIWLGGTHSNLLGSVTESLGGYLDEELIPPIYIDYGVPASARIELFFETKGRPAGGGGVVRTYEERFVSQGAYDNFQQWWEAEVVNLGDFDDAVVLTWYRDVTTNYLRLMIVATGEYSPSAEGKITIRYSTGDLIFETEPKANYNETFYETGQTFDIVNGEHLGGTDLLDQDQDLVIIPNAPAICLLDAFNCYVMGNGAESYQYKDKINADWLNIDLRPTATSLEKYKEIRRYADFTYSEPYNSNSGINGLNEFNLFRGNYKDDLEKKYGSVQKLIARDTDLVVWQEDKVSKVLFGKDLLSNADGTGNLSAVGSVLAQQVTYAGEYGISKCPESIARFGNRIYWNDPKRGTPLRLSIDGITELSMYEMEDFFKDIFREFPDARYQGGYDPYFDEYLLAIKLPGTTCDSIGFTIGFSEKVKGWTSLYSFYPEGMIGMNNDLYSFKCGELWLHNSENVPRNNFYGEQFSSLVTTIFNDSPSNDKIFKSLVLEANKPWKASIKTNLSNSVINLREFVEKESRYFAYIRNNEDGNSLRGNAAQGVGNIVSIDTLDITFTSIPNEASIGDKLMQGTNNPTSVLGVITAITGPVITLDAVAGSPTAGMFCFIKKDSRIEGGEIRGYYAEVTLESTDTDFTELYAVNSNISRSDLYSNE